MFYNDYEHFINKIVWFIPSKKHRDNFRKILYDVVNSMYKLEYITNVLNNKIDNEDNVVIIETSGGIADQFGKYVLGEAVKKYNRKVKYDLTWFRTHNKDVDGKHERPFELLKLLPDIDYDIASEDEVFVYKACFGNIIKEYFDYDINDILLTKKNIYLSGYPKIPDIEIKDLVKDIDLDKYHFNSLKGENLLLYNDLKKYCSISVHARLGDSHIMSDFRTIFHSDYNEYTDYFVKSINNIYNKFKSNNPKFFFFSDDIEWVNKNVIPKLSKDILYTIVNEKNPPHIDIYLISNAKHQIISLGGFGNLASLFNKNDNKTVISPKDFQWLK